MNPRLKRKFIALSALGLLGGAGALYFFTRGQASVSESPQYQSIVKNFFGGVVALQAADFDHASEYLTEFTKLEPLEPAGWANLGILQTRLSNYAEAAKMLAEADRLAPNNARITAARADLEIAQGRSGEAVPLLRKVLQLDPSNIRARYALAVALAADTGDASQQAEVRLLYDAILKKYPTNLVVLIEAARLAASSGDSASFGPKLQSLRATSKTWSPEAAEALAGVEAAAKGGVRAAIIPLIPLSNLLKPSAPYQAGLAVLGANTETGTARSAEPFEQFLTLNPSTLPTIAAPPDEALSFTSQPFAGAATASSKASSVVAIALDEKGTPGVFATGIGAQASTLSRLTKTPLSLAFPAGPRAVASGSNGVLGLDWNFDFRSDLALAGAGGLRLLAQNAAGNFVDVTRRLKLPLAVTQADYSGAWAADTEADGDLDMVLAGRTGAPLVIRNNGDDSGEVLRPFSGVQGVRDFAWADFDDDGAVDAAFVNSQGKLQVFSNERAGVFRERSSPTASQVLAITASDINQDSLVDIVALQADGAIVRITSTPQADSWSVQPVATWQGFAASTAPGQARILAADLDNNGGVDLLASSNGASGGTKIWLSGADNAFDALKSPVAAEALGVIDINSDGRLDLAGLDSSGAPVQMVNAGREAYHYQVLRPLAQAIKRSEGDGAGNSGSGRINPFGVGGTIEVRSGLLYQKQVITGPTVHFGLGRNTATDAARIIWPNGVPQGEFGLKGDASIQAEQRPIGSCPFLWAWDGKAISFIKDCNWRSPLGLKINAQDTAGVVQTEDWVKVPGDRIVPRDGFYDLRVTADLWEAHIFDQIALLTVDHPPGSEVWVDERFSIPMPPLQVIVTGKSQPTLSAVDDRKQDVAATVRDVDARYLDTFGRGRYQGVTRDHWVEVELPPASAKLPAGAPLWLIAEGFLHPTDSSINVALSQGKHPAPRDLSLEVANGKGGWAVAQPHLGFPAGKLKAIVLDLKKVFVPGAPRKLRLRTNLEIYWDRLSWATAAPGGAATRVKPRRQLASSAQLRYRGVSPLSKKNQSSPMLPFAYPQVDAGQPWRDLVGFYTRFGDVVPLLSRVDDRYVIMSSGDEMRLKFRESGPLRAGWKRDFVFITDAWTKDGNLNTGFSKTLLPMPLHDKPMYTTPPGPLRDDPAFKRHPRDWQTFHTRYIGADRFRNAMRPQQQQKN